MSGCLCSIVPPNVLEQVARTGSPADREAALNTLAIDHSLRTLRIENGTLRNQRHVIAPLAMLAQRSVDLSSPALIVVGNVVRFAQVAAVEPKAKAA